MKNWKTEGCLVLSLVLVQLVAPTIAHANEAHVSCGELESQVGAEIQHEVDKQFSSMKYQARNSALLEAIVTAGKNDQAVRAAFVAMQGQPKLDNETRLKFNDLLVNFMYEKKLRIPKALVVCPVGYVVDQTKLSAGLWQPEGQPGFSRQGWSESARLAEACAPVIDLRYAYVPDSSVLPLEYTSVDSLLGYSAGPDNIEYEPALIASTNVTRPVAVKFRGKSLVLTDLTVMTYLHLNNGSIVEIPGTIYLHNQVAKIDGREIDLESYIDNEVLPKACKDFHSTGPRPEVAASANAVSVESQSQNELKATQIPAN